MGVQDHKLACITLDIEPDFTHYAFDPNRPRFYGLFDEPGQFDRFCNLMAKHDVKLTCFVVGSVLRDRPDHLRELARLGVEFGSHSLTHDLDVQGTESEVRGGVDAFAEFFGHLPQGYRSPFFKLRSEMLETLERLGVCYDSSFMPSISPINPAVYHNLNGPIRPFRWQGFSLVELPLAVLPRIRLPLALSYIKVFGTRFYSILERILGIPDPLVTFLHPMNLVYSPQAFDLLSARWQIANSRNRRHGFEIFDWFLTRLRANGYQFVSMGGLLVQVSSGHLPEVSPGAVG